MISSLASKCQDFKVEMPFFQPLYVIKLKTSKFKVLAFCCFLGNRMNRTQNIPDEIATEMKAKIYYDYYVAHALGSR